ncbi:MAG: hypothetical protein K0M40_21580 [Prolixibacteraceae bacterium]|nr:hypothetical protein [Prolixibacteraceae bacterium]
MFKINMLNNCKDRKSILHLVVLDDGYKLKTTKLELMIFDKIYGQFEKDKIGENEICNKCRKGTNICTTPLSPYLISDEEINPNDRIMFIGKTARGSDFGEETDMFYEDVTTFGNDYIRNSSWAYYSYTRDIIEKYYGSIDAGIKYITYSNLMKCNNDSSKDTTPYSAKQYCLNENKFIWKEIDIIQPGRLIFYSHHFYDDFIESFRPSNFYRFSDITDKSNAVEVGAKYSLYWHREFFDKDNKLICAFLRTSHPERLNKEDFVQNVLRFLKDTENK